MLSDAAKKLIQQLQVSDIKEYYQIDTSPKVKVDDFVGKLSFIYEKIRNAIDYREDHLLRKAAIFRILQRRLTIKINIEDIASALVKEIIRAGYLENDFLPESKIQEVDKIINKYLTLFNFSRLKDSSVEGKNLFKWLIDLAACEIEECLMPPLADRALSEFAFKVLRPAVNIEGNGLSPEQKDLYVYLAIYQALVKSDNAMVDLFILRYFYPSWKKATAEDVLPLAQKIGNFRNKIYSYRQAPLNDLLTKSFKKYAFVFSVVRDVIMEDPAEAQKILDSPERFEKLIIKTCDSWYKRVKVKLRRSIWRVILYLFLTKMLLAIFLELPYDRYIAGEVLMFPLIVNILLPPFIMFVLALFIKVPSKKNTAEVVHSAKEAVYTGIFAAPGRWQNFNPHHSKVLVGVFHFFYFVLFSFSFGGLIYCLSRIGFNIFSIAVFLIFLSLVSFFGIKLRSKVRSLQIIDRKDNPLVFIINLLALPFLKAGQWMSQKFSKINVFVFFFDFIIEAPFKVFVEVVEEWVGFLREKKEEIYNQE